jgi:hypothetical protein
LNTDDPGVFGANAFFSPIEISLKFLTPAFFHFCFQQCEMETPGKEEKTLMTPGFSEQTHTAGVISIETQGREISRQ